MANNELITYFADHMNIMLLEAIEERSEAIDFKQYLEVLDSFRIAFMSCVGDSIINNLEMDENWQASEFKKHFVVRIRNFFLQCVKEIDEFRSVNEY